MIYLEFFENLIHSNYMPLIICVLIFLICHFSLKALNKSDHKAEDVYYVALNFVDTGIESCPICIYYITSISNRGFRFEPSQKAMEFDKETAIKTCFSFTSVGISAYPILKTNWTVALMNPPKVKAFLLHGYSSSESDDKDDKSDNDSSEVNTDKTT